MIVINIDQLVTNLGLSSSDLPELTDIVEAVQSMVGAWVPAAEHARPEITRGASMLAARLWRRRSSPSGVETLGDLGSVYVARYDPDIATLLGIGSHSRLVVG